MSKFAATQTRETKQILTLEAYPGSDSTCVSITALYWSAIAYNLILLAVNIISVHRIKSRGARIAFWLTFLSSQLMMLDGVIYYATENKAAHYALNFLWGLCASLMRGGLSYMIFVRAFFGMFRPWVKNLALFGVFLTFAFSLADQFWWAWKFMHDPFAGYQPVLAVLDGGFAPLYDLALYMTIWHNLYQSRHNLPQGSTFATAFLTSQLLRSLAFFSLHAINIAYGFYPYSSPPELMIIDNMLRLTQPFIILTDLERTTVIMEVSFGGRRRRSNSSGGGGGGGRGREEGGEEEKGAGDGYGSLGGTIRRGLREVSLSLAKSESNTVGVGMGFEGGGGGGVPPMPILTSGEVLGQGDDDQA
ncbi:hypothetical protein HK097_008175 [Rhizophlyctis rosea]|uniref:Uncharacterized protein n=1 Tax=Rhizophlyctis rosea TaxID=64517 RepID=A0AAD5SDT4_9FUNG|nr:hypothetical protein HK097_008175 [Rhizophlyctis rosea]